MSGAKSSEKKQEPVLKFKIERRSGVVKLLFCPFESKKYNWKVRCKKVEHELLLSFKSSLSIFLMTPQTWEKALMALRSEVYVFGNHLPWGPGKRTKQMFLTWFQLPQTEEDLRKFEVTEWHRRLIEDHQHEPENKSNICVLCGIFCKPEFCSSDEEEEEERCICGKKPKRCKCKKCGICGKIETECECQLCAKCMLCRCGEDSYHRDLHLGENSTCTCGGCQDCHTDPCECEDSSESALFF